MSINILQAYINQIQSQFQTHHAREHAYRPALHDLFHKITNLNIVNDPKRSEHGAPDFIFLNPQKQVICYAEAKDIIVSLAEIEKSEQMGRYYGYSNLILTNALEFRFYKNGEKYIEPIQIGNIISDKIIFDESKFQLLEDSISEFVHNSFEPITSGTHLAKVMAGKARRIRDNVRIFLNSENAEDKSKELYKIYNVIKTEILKDLDTYKFADLYAQTLVYGLFVARYHDESKDNFSRAEARDLIPATNPFLRQFFDHIAGPSFDSRIEIIVNELCEEFLHADVKSIVHKYYQSEKSESKDPIIHFYEDFLQEYDPIERKKLGVFYTPLPIVKFIVHSVDQILKTEFGITKGLADSSKIEIEREIIGAELKKSQVQKEKVEIHKVQVLDPATGTGTFLNEVILQIYNSFKSQAGLWQSYVKESLLPRLHGFELMMASYTIAHLKLSSTLMETGVDLNERIGIYLTNSLEEAHDHPKDLFEFGLKEAIQEETRLASKVKRDLPIMVVVGNPPYSGESNNNFESANNLVSKYKVEPDHRGKLQERNSKWLNDDYVKFIALAEDLIAKTGEGVLGFITNHSYLDNPTFRGMRWHLTQTFDKIYVIDLHGNAKKKEKAPDGSKDENVFDIQQGVAIIIAVKLSHPLGIPSENRKCEVKVRGLFGSREKKFEMLDKMSLEDFEFYKIDLDPKQYYLVYKNNSGKEEYEKGFKVNELFKLNGVGMTTAHDDFVISDEKENLIRRFEDFKNSHRDAKLLHSKFNVSNKQGWDILKGWDNLQTEMVSNLVVPVSYRPFDSRYIMYEDKLVWRTVRQIMQHFIKGENVGLTFIRNNQGIEKFSHVLITDKILDAHMHPGLAYVAPLYLYTDSGEKTPNLDIEIWKKIDSIVSSESSVSPSKKGKTTPENILDYIYAVLHSPSYRQKYGEFLKIDFPRVPYPSSSDEFWRLAELGEKLRKLHLMIDPEVENLITTYPISGSDEVEKVIFKDDQVWINSTQYFGDVPAKAWDFYIGGYQPAQKWLKDRKGRKLSSDEIVHYQKIIKVLSETEKLMEEIG